MKTKATRRRPNKFIRVITIPFRALCRVREFYVRTMMDCASSNVSGVQGTLQQAPAQRRSFSLSSPRSSDTNEEDYMELVRAASARNMVGRINLDAYLRQEIQTRSCSRAMARRSPSAAMGPIDEERPCCYSGEDVINGNSIVSARSESKSPIRYICNAVTRMTF